jgi:hypothetical protein
MLRFTGNVGGPELRTHAKETQFMTHGKTNEASRTVRNVGSVTEWP